MICRVAWRVLTGNGASDERSDEEDEDEDEWAVFSINYSYDCWLALGCGDSDKKRD